MKRGTNPKHGYLLHINIKNDYISVDWSKYRARPCVIDGKRFASQKEGARYIELKALLRSGRISDLRLQVRYNLIPAHKKSGGKTEARCDYVADFVYFDRARDCEVVEDVKGMRTPAYIIKRKLMLDRYGIEILET